jgi:hypothetical protein
LVFQLASEKKMAIEYGTNSSALASPSLMLLCVLLVSLMLLPFFFFFFFSLTMQKAPKSVL